MARLSATSSSVDTSNGHVVEPTMVPLTADENVPAEKSVDDTSVPVTKLDHHDTNDEDDEPPAKPDPTLLPGGSRDLSFIGLQAFVLGSIFAFSACSTAYLLSISSAWWRLPTFAICFSVFHFLEYWTTAAYNTPACRASSFLLFNNGTAYTAANAAATVEIIVTGFFPQYQGYGVSAATIAVGWVLVVVGQTVRSVAMVQASTNFNHIVQQERKDTHVLVTEGLYSYFRHPSYFGFFWWSIGTQLLVGNKVCLAAFVVVLWRFFNRRITVEEQHLNQFFPEYKDYKKRTGTMIPFIA